MCISLIKKNHIIWDKKNDVVVPIFFKEMEIKLFKCSLNLWASLKEHFVIHIASRVMQLPLKFWNMSMLLGLTFARIFFLEDWCWRKGAPFPLWMTCTTNETILKRCLKNGLSHLLVRNLYFHFFVYWGYT